jgi:hypothetical protein
MSARVIDEKLVQAARRVVENVAPLPWSSTWVTVTDALIADLRAALEGEEHEKLTLEHAREIAARVWCDQDMSHVEMDVGKAERIAEILIEPGQVPPSAVTREEVERWVKEYEGFGMPTLTRFFRSWLALEEDKRAACKLYDEVLVLRDVARAAEGYEAELGASEKLLTALRRWKGE